ncbi:kinetochore complex Sim4 subunit Fta1-domain-containing protein [Amylocarpus encephaloides]|uniref:Kinetochore complex Sim4 subunit Fta1-domain-containing protein n=1 Tax=Amylocarpus encephaloides TaxID=45428 RepID=A0A9P7YGM5_9HELO|nr:kinetochore complex Sim4 subunit Fta1-domain-containing protein [Amylocarpus encephaloides]
MATQSQDVPPYPLYDTTFNLYRASPLYTGNDSGLDDLTLRQQAAKFRDILVGDVLRGVRVGLEPEDGTLAYSGALQTVTWTLLPAEERWKGQLDTQSVGDEDTTINLSDGVGLLVTVAYEKIQYTAVLLRAIRGGNWDETTAGVELDEGFEHFPLLLVKMPASLRETFVDFLSTTFDARISPLQFPSAYVTTTFEQYLAYICVGEDGEPLDTGESTRAMKKIVGGIEVYVGFDLPGGSSTLKTIDIKISKEDLPRIISRGKTIQNGKEDAPLWNALTAYVNAHLALDLNHDRVRIMRIACDAFVFGAEGKIKLFHPDANADEDGPQRRTTKRFLGSLIDVAKGNTLSKSLQGD